MAMIWMDENSRRRPETRTILTRTSRDMAMMITVLVPRREEMTSVPTSGAR